MMEKYRHPDPDVWLGWLATIGKWPGPLKELGECYPGVTCYRMGDNHLWIQAYEFGGTYGAPKLFATVLHGADSHFPGITINKVPVEKLTICDCGKWMPSTKEQGEQSQAKYLEAQTIASRKEVQQ